MVTCSYWVSLKEVSCFNVYIPYHTNLRLWRVSELLGICSTHCNLYYFTILTMLHELYKTVISLSHNNLNFPLTASHLSPNGFLDFETCSLLKVRDHVPHTHKTNNCWKITYTHTYTDTLILCSWSCIFFAILHTFCKVMAKCP